MRAHTTFDAREEREVCSGAGHLADASRICTSGQAVEATFAEHFNGDNVMFGLT